VSKRPACHYDTQHGWLTPDTDSGRPCPKDHCGLRGEPCGHHVNHAAGIYTCPTCISRFRRDLTTIKTLNAVELVEEALEAGINSEAATLIGPASLDAPSDTELREADDWQRGHCSWPQRPEKPIKHPLVILGDLEHDLRASYGPHTTLRPTVDRAADYLTALLNGPFPHDDQFENTARTVANLRAHLEAVAHTARHAERGHPCPTCTKDLPDNEQAPRLLKHYATGSGTDVTTGRLDTWHCPTNTAHWWTDSDYRAQVDAMHREQVKAGRWLTATEAAEKYGVTPRAVHKWGQRGKVRTRFIGEALRYDTQGLEQTRADA
jgi:hypothetical protein